MFINRIVLPSLYEHGCFRVVSDISVKNKTHITAGNKSCLYRSQASLNSQFYTVCSYRFSNSQNKREKISLQ